MPTPEIDLAFLRNLLREAGALALNQRGQMIAEVKPDLSPVTAVDHQMETFLMDRILTRHPDHLILSEESGTHAISDRAEFAWVIDPIDGTRAFATGLPVWGISAGILRQGQPYAGGFYLPVSDELYWGTITEAWCNQRRLPRLGAVDPHSSLNFVAVPSNFHHHFETTAPRIRSMGSTAAHLAYVATGAALGMVTRTTNLWDLAGVLPLALAVGVELVYLSGQPFNAGDLLDGKSTQETLLVGSPSALELLRQWVKIKK